MEPSSKISCRLSGISAGLPWLVEVAADRLMTTVWKQVLFGKEIYDVPLPGGAAYADLGKEGTFHVKLLPEKIGAKPFKALKNLESGEVVSGKGNEFSVKIPYHDFAVFSAEE